jgi:hypothetical protein
MQLETDAGAEPGPGLPGCEAELDVGGGKTLLALKLKFRERRPNAQNPDGYYNAVLKYPQARGRLGASSRRRS